MIKSRAAVKAKQTQIKAMAHQQASLVHDSFHPRVFDMSDAGTGKTFVRVMAFAARRRKRGGCLLVMCPRSLMTSVWASDFRKFAPDMVVLVADATNREKVFAQDADVYVTNHDAAKWLVKQKPSFFKRFSELVIDESTAFKHHTSQRSRAMGKLTKHFERRANLTMTPTSNGITDIWHQVLLLDDGKRLGPSFYGFRNSVCEAKQMGANRNAIQWTDKDGAEEAVYQLIDDIVIRHRLEDCVDIPPTHTHTLTWQLSPKLRKAYETMEQDRLLPIIQQMNNPSVPAHVLAINAASVMTKLLQICSGAVYRDAHEYTVLDSSRYELLLGLAEERKHPLLYFFWGHQRDLLVEEAKKRKLKYAVLEGATKDAERRAIELRYQAGEFDVLFAHPKVTAHGFTFTRGTSTIWPGPTWDLEWFIQGSRRQARIGQKEKTEVLTVLAEGTREIEVYDWMLMPKNERMGSLLSLAAQGMKDKELEAA